MKFFKKLSCLLVLSLITIISAGCANQKLPKNPISKTELVIGTVCTVTIYDKSDTTIIDEAFTRLRELENILSINKSNTELDKVNKMAGIEPVEVSDDTFNVIKKGLEYSKLSDGALDITIGPLVKLWGIGTDNAKVPSEEEINEKKGLVDYNKVEIDESKKSIFLKDPNMIIDLGAIAKGYAADEVAKFLKDAGVSSAIVDLGGNIYVLGDKINGTPWKVGVQNPDKSDSDTIGFVDVSNKSIVTSGIYERYFEHEGKNYHHILSPETGYPYDNNILGVSILSDKSIDGDSLSTTLFALGVDKGLELINSLNGVEAIFITKDHELYLTNGFKEVFTLTNNDYKIKE
ncbi:FAD:protein FMN transferase [uncultured Clostridium sp.]|uniref:FAD:protein FMN transferase n=1 Tax=uncultured Clostridium sp. TaxID=59620 RepID=UPI00321695EB